MYLYRPKITFAFCITVGIEHKLRLQLWSYKCNDGSCKDLAFISQ